MSQRNTLSFPERVSLAIIENATTGAMNANQVLDKIPRESNFTKEMVHKALLNLANKGMVRESNKGVYISIRRDIKKTGELVLSNRGDYYVRIDLDGDTQQLFLDNDSVGRFLPGDIVLCELKSKGKRTYVKSLQLSKRIPKRYSGTLEIVGKNVFAILQKNGMRDVKILRPGEGLINGYKVLVEVVDFPINSQQPVGNIIEVLGMAGEIDTEMHAIVSEFGFNTQFPAAVLAEISTIPKTIHSSDYAKRKDLRDLFCITIDPADAKDFDDAISLSKNKEGNYLLGVHIADVSHFVIPDTAIDREALARGTSVYLVDRTISMLPEVLSNDLCSLKPHVDRLAFSVIFTLNKTFAVIDQWFGKTVINSKRRFSYEDAQEVILTKKGDYAEELNLLNTIAKHFEAIRFENGALKFNSKEIRFVFNANKKPIEAYEKKRFEAHMLIETFMLMANEAVAKYVKTLQKPTLPFLFRSHDLPPNDKLLDFAKFCKLMGYPIQIDNEPQMRSSFNALLDRTAHDPSAEILQQMAIRTMAKAVYTAYRSSHFGLAFEFYTHFTSPIRRYPDLLVHRLLFQYLEDPSQKMDESQIETIAKHSSAMEQKAAEAERASTKYMLAQMMEQHKGKTMDATITGITEWGIYAMATEFYCEGLIRISDVKGDRFVYNEAEKKMIGQRTRRSFHLGDTISVSVKKSDPVKRLIEFNLLNY